ncbi:hypothetical protein CAPTEDRAFT_105319, partial [Capitella teleta]
QQKYLKNQKPVMPKDPHILKVAIVGAPNAGKSTLANQLMKWRFSAVSSKPHTTRRKMMGVLTEENSQIVFIDSPGITEPSKQKKFKLERSLLTDPHEAFYEADMIVVVVDVSIRWCRNSLHSDILKVLHLHSDKPSVLVLNKIDTLKSRRQLLQMTKQLTNGMVGRQQNFWRPIKQRIKKCRSTQYSSNPLEENHVVVDGYDFDNPVDFHKYYRSLEGENAMLGGWGKFDTVFMMSALQGEGVEPLKSYLLDSAKPGNWLYHSSLITDQHPIEMARLCVWEKVLDYAKNDIPYKIIVTVSDWHVDDNGILRISFILHCKKKRELLAVLGKEGCVIKQISKEATQALQDTFRRDLTISIRAVYEDNKHPLGKKVKWAKEDDDVDSDDDEDLQ